MNFLTHAQLYVHATLLLRIRTMSVACRLIATEPKSCLTHWLFFPFATSLATLSQCLLDCGAWTIKLNAGKCVELWTIWFQVYLPRSCKTLHDKVSLSKEHQTHTQTDCNDIRPHTAQFYNERISTDLNLATRQSIVHEPPEDSLKNWTETWRGKFLSVFNVNFSAF